MLGCMLALADHATLARVARMWPAGLAGLLVWLALGTWDSPVLYGGGFTVIAACATTLIAASVAARDSAVARVLAWAPLRALGRISYGMYVWHYPLLAVLEVQYGMSPGRAMLVGGVASTGVAALSFMLMERPLMTRRRALARPLKRLLACFTPAQLAVGVAYLALLYER